MLSPKQGLIHMFANHMNPVLTNTRGAVYRGLEGNQVDNRKARCHYGVSYRTPFNPDEHEQRDKEWCKYEEEWKAGNQMDWYIRKVKLLQIPLTSCRSLSLNFLCRQGESTSENKPISIGYYRCVPINHSFVFHEELMMSCKDQAPKVHSKKRVVSINIDMSTGVRVHCELVSDLSKIPKRLFLKKKNSSGQEYYDVRYSLVLTPLSASMNFELVFKGINYGKVSASYF
ncbi:hypothetical protein N7456_001233 [Penicillium angulare]|uniref:Uncharacterized protein n=1 Tax=Penicillium angulare TaxID=116970 RepID=A0A9W9KSV9_9EURO|nr:hypothetical protein N7456_001233 [Penicillium angulare]